jgi:hypothetical protein
MTLAAIGLSIVLGIIAGGFIAGVFVAKVFVRAVAKGLNW